MSSETPTFDIRLDSLLQVFSGLQNPYTGMGNPYVDPTQHTYIQPGLSRLSRQEQSALVRQSGLLKKLTTNLPKAATWRWGRPTLANGDAKLLQSIADAVNNIPVVTPLQRLGRTKKGYQIAGELALQTGNSGLVLDVDDGRKLDEPLDREHIKRINKMALLSRHALRPDISTLSSGLPEHYIVLNTYNMKGYANGQRIHRSRVHWFRGVPILDDYDLIANNGCDDSILELVRDAWFMYQPAVQAAGRMLTDFDVPVRKVKDLAQNLADRGDEYKAELLTRLQVDQISRSNYRTQVIDMDNEALDNWTRQVTGMSDLHDRVKENLLASIDLPPAIAFGEFASGLNSTGQSTTENQLWNETTTQFQVDKYDDSIQDLQQLVCLCKSGPTNGDLPDGLGWEWLPPYPPSPAEQADLELKRAQLIQDLNGVDPRFGKVAIAATYGQKEYSSAITLPKPYAEALQRDIKEEAKPQPTEPDVSALQGGDQPADGATADEDQALGQDEQAQQDQSIADDILSDRALLDSADSFHLDDATPVKRIIDWQGLKLGLQYQPFDIRHGKVLPVAYGHIQKTRGADGMACDCYVGTDLESNRVFEVTQLIDGQFDEHKYMLGFDSLDTARETFLKVMPADMFGGIKAISLADLERYRLDAVDSPIDTAYAKYHGAVNMSASEFLAWSKTRWSKLASVDRAPIQRNLRLLQKPKAQWTQADATQALRTVSFIARMRGAGKGEPVSADAPVWMTKRLISLRNWAYDPRKFAKQDSDVRLDATRQELLAKAKAKNEGLEKGKKFNTFGKSNVAIAEFVGEGAATPATPKTATKAKGGTKGGKYQTSKTSSAIATAIAKKTGADPESIEKDLRGKIQKAIDKTRREAKKAGKEPTAKELRAAARAVVKVEARSAIAAARGEDKPAVTSAKAEKASAKAKTEKAEKKTRSVKPKTPATVAEKPTAEKKPKRQAKAKTKAKATEEPKNRTADLALTKKDLVNFEELKQLGTIGENKHSIFEDDRGQKYVAKVASAMTGYIPYDNTSEMIAQKVMQAAGINTAKIKIEDPEIADKDDRYPRILSQFVSGVSLGEVQKFTQPDSLMLSSKDALKNAISHPDLARIHAFDVFSFNGDRHDGNIFYDQKTDSYHAIDNEGAFYKSPYSPYRDYEREAIEKSFDSVLSNKKLTHSEKENLHLFVETLRGLADMNKAEFAKSAIASQDKLIPSSDEKQRQEFTPERQNSIRDSFGYAKELLEKLVKAGF
ncbi:MAG: DUF1073 domain-containing protein [Stenomitos rutilans HA7619-LM2]|jgi:phage-related protein (TIGR01555 family)|nr:DUF1073 domain-containing protein [Stenomitos rutilans HA7619-LM2]MBW4469448.1 DUF1073 domain-containing protein [Stenomitos rutilans HA7619-LM2]